MCRSGQSTPTRKMTVYRLKSLGTRSFRLFYVQDLGDVGRTLKLPLSGGYLLGREYLSSASTLFSVVYISLFGTDISS